MITIKNTQRKIKVHITKILSEAHAILNLLNYEDFDLGIWLTNDRTIRQYNKNYRNIDRPTDILSFPYHNIKAGQKIRAKTEEEKNLGDLILSMEYIQKSAEKLNISLEKHLKKLLVHGICHLIGYDHIEDKDWRSMRAKEAWILKQIS